MAIQYFFYAYGDNPESSEFQPLAIADHETYHWDSEKTWGQGFETRDEAMKDFLEAVEDGRVEDEDSPEIYEIGSELDGLREDFRNNLFDVTEYMELCLGEAGVTDVDVVFYTDCPRGFANEISLCFTNLWKKDSLSLVDHYQVVSYERALELLAQGLRSHADDYRDYVNTYQNPSCGVNGLVDATLDLEEVAKFPYSTVYETDEGQYVLSPHSSADELYDTIEDLVDANPDCESLLELLDS